MPCSQLESCRPRPTVERFTCVAYSAQAVKRFVKIRTPLFLPLHPRIRWLALAPPLLDWVPSSQPTTTPGFSSARPDSTRSSLPSPEIPVKAAAPLNTLTRTSSLGRLQIAPTPGHQIALRRHVLPLLTPPSVFLQNIPWLPGLHGVYGQRIASNLAFAPAAFASKSFIVSLI